MYSTPASNICYFQKKSDSKISAQWFEGGRGQSDIVRSKSNEGFDIQAGYAYSNNWAVTASYASRTEKDSNFYNYGTNDNQSEVSYKRTLFEIGMGRFHLHKKKNSTGNLFFGLGFGSYTLNDNGIDINVAYTKYHKIPFFRLYLQPSINMVNSKYVHGSVGGRFSIMRYGKASTNYTVIQKKYWTLDLYDNKMAAFIEPNLNLQLSVPEADWIRLDLSVNFLLLSIGPRQSDRLSKHEGGAYVGLVFNPAAAFKK